MRKVFQYIPKAASAPPRAGTTGGGGGDGLTLMKGGVRLDIRTIHHKRIDIDEGRCATGHHNNTSQKN